MTKLLCYSQQISAPCESLRTSIFTSYIFQYDIVGTTVANQRWPAGGKLTVGRRRQFAGGNLPFIATGGPTASCCLGSRRQPNPQPGFPWLSTKRIPCCHSSGQSCPGESGPIPRRAFRRAWEWDLTSRDNSVPKK